MSEPLSKINNYIQNQILNNIYHIEIDLKDYVNEVSTVTILIPSKVKYIKFIGDTSYYKLSIFIQGRSSNISIFLNNVNTNSGNLIGIDFRALKESTYTNYLIYSGVNNITSENNTAIKVGNEQTIEIRGVNSSSVLNVNGGKGNAAIGSNNISDGGGYIILSGDGTVTANGGNGEFGVNSGSDGSHAIGFPNLITEKTSIEIKNKVNILIKGGDGGNIKPVIQDGKSGNGGNGISFGVNGKLIKSSIGKLSVSGGNGGIVLDGRVGANGNGGSAIYLDSGIISINTNVVLNGGNGGTGESTAAFPSLSQGGKGGNAIISVADSNLSIITRVIIGSNIIAKGGNGGAGGILLNQDMSLSGYNGGNAGHVININTGQAYVTIGDATLTSGDGGNGGSTYDDCVSPNGCSSGVGGNNGSILVGLYVLYEISNKASLRSGTPGSGGIGKNKENEQVQYPNGIVEPLINVKNPLKVRPFFDTINLVSKLVEFEYDKCINKNNFNNKINNSFLKESEESICMNKVSNIYQNFHGCINVTDVEIDNVYNQGLGIIFGEAKFSLKIDSSLFLTEIKRNIVLEDCDLKIK